MEKITIAISLAHKGSLLKLLEKSIARQSVHPHEVVYAKSDTPFRHQTLYSRAAGNLVVFLDEDCELPDAGWLARSLRVAEDNGDVSGFGGHYLSHPHASYLANSYHQLCQNWILASEGPRGFVSNLLGGCMVLRKDLIGPELPRPPETFWGGEDTFIVRALVQCGHKFKHYSDLSVLHSPSDSPKHWFRRARCHGQANRRHGVAIPRTHFTYWARHTPLKYWPPIAAHLLTTRTSQWLSR